MSDHSLTLYDTTGIHLPEDAFVVIVRTEWNAASIDKLEAGARKVLDQFGVQVRTVTVPGAFEIPLIAQKMANSKKYDAVITLGTVIRGSTPHFDYVCNEVAKGVSRITLDTGIPVIFGVLTTDSIEQAIERAGTKAGNKGWESASGAIEMANLLRNIEQ